MSWRPWLRAAALVMLILLFYVDAARTDYQAEQEVLAAMQEGFDTWRP